MGADAYLSLVFWLLALHALADYPLQGDFLARGKNHKAPIPGVSWLWCLMSHSAIHAGAVALATGLVALGLLEFVAHAAIDFGKSHGLYGFGVDQTMHIIYKLAIAALTVGVLRG